MHALLIDMQTLKSSPVACFVQVQAFAAAIDGCGNLTASQIDKVCDYAVRRLSVV